MGCGGLNSSGGAPASQGLAVGEKVSGASADSEILSGTQNADPSAPGAGPAVNNRFPASGPVSAANGTIPGAQITDPGMSGLVVLFLTYDGEVTSSTVPASNRDCSKIFFNDTLKVTRWAMDKNQTWAFPTDIPVDACGKFSSLGSIVNAYCPSHDQSCIKFVASYDWLGKHLEGEMEIPSENDFKNWDHHIALRLPGIALSEIHPFPNGRDQDIPMENQHSPLQIQQQKSFNH